MTTIVLVHGAFHGGWCYDPLIPELAARGIDAVAPDLPLTSLLDDAAAVTAVLDGIDGPVTLLGHSYGGAVVTVAGNHPSVDRLVYLTAMAPDAGEPASGGPVQIGQVLLDGLRPTDDGMLAVDPTMAAGIFYPDVDADLGAAVAANLRAGAVGGDELVERAAWRERPATYVVCDADPILLPASQRALAARIGATVVEMPGDHSPFLARPAELAAILADAMS